MPIELSLKADHLFDNETTVAVANKDDLTILFLSTQVLSMNELLRLPQNQLTGVTLCLLRLILEINWSPKSSRRFSDASR